MPYALIFAAIALAVSAYLWSLIFCKAGWHRWTGVLVVVPIANLLMFVMLSFGRWPIQDRLNAAENELRELRSRLP